METTPQQRRTMQAHCDSMGKTKGLTNCQRCPDAVRSVCHRHGVTTYEALEKWRADLIQAITLSAVN